MIIWNQYLEVGSRNMKIEVGNFIRIEMKAWMAGVLLLKFALHLIRKIISCIHTYKYVFFRRMLDERFVALHFEIKFLW